jgi:uncharacterized membrane protein YfcA
MQGPALFVLLGLVAGVLSGMFGVGGGIVLVPALMFGMGFTQLTASGTSLVALLLPVGIGGVLSYYQDGKIDATHIKAGLIIAVGMIFGSYFGSRLARVIPANLLKRLFAGLLLVTAVRTWLSIKT